MNEFNVSQEEATKLANGSMSPEKEESQKRSSLTGHDLKRAANLAGKGAAEVDGIGGKRKANIRFQKLAGDKGFQQYIGGKKGKVFSEEEMQKGLQKQIDKDPTESLLEKINQTLEGKFVSQ